MSSKRELYNRLFDFYGSLLTPKQQRFFAEYYREDYSLQEIADSEDISKAAVSDALHHCRTELDNYEEKLHLVSSYEKRIALYQKIKEAGNEEVKALVDACINIENEGGNI